MDVSLHQLQAEFHEDLQPARLLTSTAINHKQLHFPRQLADECLPNIYSCSMSQENSQELTLVEFVYASPYALHSFLPII